MTLRVGRYETLRAIASGGMATVYLGRALGAGGFERLVAIKVMHAHIADDPDFVAMFLDEARLAARVRHPNVVATIDVLQVDPPEGGLSETGPLALVMEYIEGPSLQIILRELRKGKGAIPLGIAVRIFLDILAGLHAAHELTGPDGVSLNLIHRDVSPQNMLVGHDGISRITDFGVARAESRLSSTRGGQLKGKIAYMAPEQIRTEGTDRRCDVYAAGAVLWETLVGQRLFRAENDGAMVSIILAGPKQSPRDLNLGIPAELDEACMRALRFDPRERYLTAADFAEALEGAAAAARIPVATSRAVAAFVKDLGLPQMGSLPPGEPLRQPAAAASRGIVPPSRPASESDKVAALMSVRPRPLEDPATSSGTTGASGSTQVGAVMSYTPPRRPRRGLIAFAIIAAAVGGAGLFLAGRMTHDAAPAATNVAAALAPPAASASAPVASAAPEAAEPSVAVDPTDARAVASATAPATRYGGSQLPRQAIRPLPPPPKASASAAPPSATSFRPSDL